MYNPRTNRQPLSLEDVFTSNGSLKNIHNYGPVYEPYFAHIREEPIKLLEVGVLQGYSLAAWEEFFPEGEIFGLDIYQRVSLEVAKKNVDRSSLLLGDSRSLSEELVKKAPFDIIIDDGCHHFDFMRDTLKNLWPLLSKGGLYFIEDVMHPDGQTYKHAAIRREKPEYSLQKFRSLMSQISKRDPNHTLHDQRKQTGDSSSCVFALRK